MQIYSDRFNMSSKAGVRDGLPIDLYWIMSFSITHFEPNNFCTFPNALATLKFQTLPTPWQLALRHRYDGAISPEVSP